MLFVGFHRSGNRIRDQGIGKGDTNSNRIVSLLDRLSNQSTARRCGKSQRGIESGGWSSARFRHRSIRHSDPHSRSTLPEPSAKLVGK